ncbi:hypothetical protein GCM10025857_40060 [Alicyclobacillus contaminans]|nr:hypothetical protein GCM10025857_39470 [Alicyclobacillus contaminans]GMA52649.1 hypothetical protein GCM10025857_40060 [Alicyclobacillus contaminans]
MEQDVCGYCGRSTSQPLNRYGVHDYCCYDAEREEDNADS